MDDSLSIAPANRRLPLTEPVYSYLRASQTAKECPGCGTFFSTLWFPNSYGEELVMKVEICKYCEEYRKDGNDPMDFRCQSCGERHKPRELASSVTRDENADFPAGFATDNQKHTTGLWICFRERNWYSEHSEFQGRRTSLHNIYVYSRNDRCESCGEEVPNKIEPGRWLHFIYEKGLIVCHREYHYWIKHKVLPGEKLFQRSADRLDDIGCDHCRKEVDRPNLLIWWSRSQQLLCKSCLALFKRGINPDDRVRQARPKYRIGDKKCDGCGVLFAGIKDLRWWAPTKQLVCRSEHYYIKLHDTLEGWKPKLQHSKERRSDLQYNHCGEVFEKPGDLEWYTTKKLLLCYKDKQHIVKYRTLEGKKTYKKRRPSTKQKLSKLKPSTRRRKVQGPKPSKKRRKTEGGSRGGSKTGNKPGDKCPVHLLTYQSLTLH